MDAQERTRRLLDLFLVSVLLDAGAGARWQYKSKSSGKMYRRSEGLAVASLEMFTAGLFSSDHAQPCQVDATALKRLTVEKLAKGLQVSETNPIAGLDGRAGLLIRLGQALENQRLFGATERPGNMLGENSRFDAQQRAVLMMHRLPAESSGDTNGVGSDYSSADAVVGADGWSGQHLACVENTDWGSLARRCLALLGHAILTSAPALGEHRPVP